MSMKISLVVAIAVLLCVSHLFAACLGQSLKDPAGTKENRRVRQIWLTWFSLVPWAAAMLLITAVAA